MAFQISVVGTSGIMINLQVTQEMTVETLKACVSADMSLPPESQTLTFNGTTLVDNAATLQSYGISQNEMLQVSVVGSTTPGNASASTSAALSAIQSSSNGESVSEDVLVDPSLRMEMLPPNLGPQQFHDIVRLNPQLLAEIEYTNSALAKALRENDFSSMRGLLIKYQMAAYVRKRKQAQEDQRLNDNPWDTEAQNAIAERIRRENVEQNRQMAMEHHPESFTRVLMLYIPLEVNGVKIQAFVDSGAQSTIMSQDCAERCGIMRLVDTNFAGTAVGVGTAKICGRVHLAPIKIGGTTLNCTFTVMEKNLGDRNMEFLLGLDMLKRYQCMIDLKAPARLRLRAGGNETSVQFLTEGELPESKGGRLAVDPTIAENEKTLKRKREEEAAEAKSSSSSSSTASSSSSTAPATATTATTPTAPTAPSAPSAPSTSLTSSTTPSSTNSNPETNLLSEGFSLEAIQKALADCAGSESMARVVLKFGASRT